MRILQINTEKTPGGGERQTLLMCQGLLRAGHDVTLLCRNHSPLAQWAIGAGIDTRTISIPFGALRFLAQHGKSYDLIHTQSGNAQSYASFMKPIVRLPLVNTRRYNSPIRSASSLRRLGSADCLVAISTAIKKTLEENGLGDIRVIPSAASLVKPDINRAEALRAELLPYGKKVVATVSTLTEPKDPDTMMRTVYHLSEKRDDFVFLHIGSIPKPNLIESLLDRYGIRDRCLFAGYRSTATDFFPLFDVFIITSDNTEGLFSSVYDAFYNKIPVVSTFTGGMVDSVGDRGLTCPEKDSRCLAEKIDMLLNDLELCNSLTAKAYDWVTKEVTSEVVTSCYVSLYEELLARV